jgi:hypothetical protein
MEINGYLELVLPWYLNGETEKNHENSYYPVSTWTLSLISTQKRSSMLGICIIKIHGNQELSYMLSDFINEILHVIGFDLTKRLHCMM